MADQQLLELARLDRRFDICRGRALAKPRVDRPVGKRTPHFRLRITARHLTGLLVRMHLHRKPLPGVDDFDEQRQAWINLIQSPALIRARDNEAWIRRIRRNLPTFRSPQSPMRI